MTFNYSASSTLSLKYIKIYRILFLQQSQSCPNILVAISCTDKSSDSERLYICHKKSALTCILNLILCRISHIVSLVIYQVSTGELVCQPRNLIKLYNAQAERVNVALPTGDALYAYIDTRVKWRENLLPFSCAFLSCGLY